MKKELFIEPSAESERVIHTPTDFSREHLLYLQEAGRLTASKAHNSHRENLKSYLLIVVEAGSGRLSYNNHNYPLHAGDCAFIDCSVPYTHSTSSDPWTLTWTHFYGQHFAPIYDRYFKAPEHVVFTPHDPSGIIQNIADIEMIAKADFQHRELKIHEKLTMLCTSIINEANRSEALETPSSAWAVQLSEIRAYIETHYHEHISLDDLSDKFYVNKFTMIRYFKNQYGLSPVAFLLHTRITHAKELLRFSNISIDDVAYRTGFQDGNYFARSFKKIEQTTPSEYRKHWVTVGETK